MSACTFFGHRDCYGLDECVLQNAIEELICCGVDIFYVGNQGYFDKMTYRCLKQLREKYPHIRVCIVLAYLPAEHVEFLGDSMYPEIEGFPRFAIQRRNRWMIEQAGYCLRYVNRTWGGAYKFAAQAKRRGLMVINLGSASL